MSEAHLVIEPNRCNCAALRKASRRISQFYNSALASAGLRSTRLAVLVELDRRTDEPPTIRELSEALVMDQSTIGQNLRPLEREGLIALVQDEADRRSRRVKLTRTGRSRLAAAQPLWSVAQQRFGMALASAPPPVAQRAGENRPRSVAGRCGRCVCRKGLNP